MLTDSVSVVVITLNRPGYVEKCLRCLAAQTRTPDEVIVVDASANDLTRRVVEGFSGVIYIQNQAGVGRMTTSRNLALRVAAGEIIAFVDDDAFAEPGWLDSLLGAYGGEADIGAVGGRARNKCPGEETSRIADIGRVQRTGEVTGFFAAHPGCVIEVDHIMGCNMSFRRGVLARLGGFREDYPGISGVCEDTDMCLRVRTLKYRILFTPWAVVDHVGAPQANGKRFDARYAYFSQRNHVVMLMRNFGPWSPLLFRYAFYTVVRNTKWLLKAITRRSSNLPSTLTILAADSLGWYSGAVIGLWSVYRLGRSPERTDTDGKAVSDALLSGPSTTAPIPMFPDCCMSRVTLNG